MTQAPQRLTLRIQDGPALQRLLEAEIVKGALFVPCQHPPEPATRVQISVQIGTVAQPFEFEGIVIHTQQVGESGSELGPGAGVFIQQLPQVLQTAQQLLTGLGLVSALVDPGPRPPGSTVAVPDPAPHSSTVRSRRAERSPSVHRRAAGGVASVISDINPPPVRPGMTSSGGPAIVTDLQLPPGRTGTSSSSSSRLLNAEFEALFEPGAVSNHRSAPSDAANSSKTSSDLEEEIVQDPVDVLRRVKAFLDQGSHVEFYRTLGVARTATGDEIRQAFFSLARQYHPDNYFRRVSTGLIEDLEVAYQRICEAYHVLSDPDRRLKYDLSIGITSRAQGEPEALSRKRFAAQLASRFRDRHAEQVTRAQALFAKAKISAEAGDTYGACATLRIALTFDPFHEEGRRLLEAIEAKLGPQESPGSSSKGLRNTRPATSRPSVSTPQRPVRTVASMGGSAERSQPRKTPSRTVPIAPKPGGSKTSGARVASKGTQPAENKEIEALLRQIRQALSQGQRGAARVWLLKLLTFDAQHAEARRLLEQLEKEEPGTR